MKNVMKTLSVLLFLACTILLLAGFRMVDKPEKVSPVGTDIVGIENSEAGWVVNKIELQNLPVSNPAQTLINTKADLDSPEFPNGISVPPNAVGPQLIELGGDTDLGTGRVGIGSPAANTVSFIELLPLTTPAAGQIKAYGAPFLLKFSDNVTRNAVQAYWTDPGTGSGAINLVDLLDWPSGLTPAELSNVDGSTGNLQSQINSLSVSSMPQVTGGYPVVGGCNLNTTDKKIYCRLADGSVYASAAMTYITSVDTVAPVISTATIDTTGLYLVVTANEAIKAAVTSALCDSFTATMTEGAIADWSYVSGNNTNQVTCATLTQIYSGPAGLLAYAPGTITDTSGNPLAAFSGLNLTNNSTVTPVASCGPSSRTVNETFDTDLSAFSEAVGSWTINTSRVTASVGTQSFLRKSTILDPECQWASVNVGTGGFGTTTHAGFFLRGQPDGTGFRHVIRYSNAVNTLYWLIYENNSPVANLHSETMTALSPDDRIAARLIGFNADTVLQVWINPVGASPDDWGAPTYTWTEDPIAEVISGSYVGVYNWNQTGQTYIGTFEAGN
ncbi:MAG: hypothetical protein WBB19_10870 [Desulforhopalus sp.]